LVKVRKLEFIQEKFMKAQKGTRGITTLSLTSMPDGFQRQAPAALPPGKILGTHCTGGWVGPRADLDGCRKSRLVLYSTWQVTVPTTVFQPIPNNGCIKTEILWSLEKLILILIIMCTLVAHFECNKVNVRLLNKMQLTLILEPTPFTSDIYFEQCLTCTPVLPLSVSIGRSRGDLFTSPGKVTEKRAAMFYSC